MNNMHFNGSGSHATGGPMRGIGLPEATESMKAQQRERTAAYRRMHPQRGEELTGEPEQWRHNDTQTRCTVRRYARYARVLLDEDKEKTPHDVTPFDCEVKPLYKPAYIMPYIALPCLFTREEPEAK